MSASRLLCMVGIHARLRDREAPAQTLRLFTTVDEFFCRRCSARWERKQVTIGGDVGIMWERVA